MSGYTKKEDLDQEILILKENIANLDEITAEKIAQWDSNHSVDITDLELKIQSVKDNLLDYQLATNHRFENLGDITTMLESLQTQINTMATHTHRNAEILDSLTAEMIAEWNQTADKLHDTATVLATNLTTMGVPATADENLNILVSKILEIPQTNTVTSVNTVTLLDTSHFTSKEETLNVYGNYIYLCEDPETGFVTLDSIVEKWGGVTATNNYIQNEPGKYGICVSNWTESNVNTQILFAEPIVFKTSLAIFELNCFLSDWITQTLHLHLIAVSATNQNEILEEITQKINSEEYAYTKTFAIGGAYSLKDILIKCENIPDGTYYLVIDGTTKGDNSNFTYVKLSYIANL